MTSFGDWIEERPARRGGGMFVLGAVATGATMLALQYFLGAPSIKPDDGPDGVKVVTETKYIDVEGITKVLGSDIVVDHTHFDDFGKMFNISMDNVDLENSKLDLHINEDGPDAGKAVLTGNITYNHGDVGYRMVIQNLTHEQTRTAIATTEGFTEKATEMDGEAFKNANGDVARVYIEGRIVGSTPTFEYAISSDMLNDTVDMIYEGVSGNLQEKIKGLIGEKGYETATLQASMDAKTGKLKYSFVLDEKAWELGREHWEKGLNFLEDGDLDHSAYKIHVDAWENAVQWYSDTYNAAYAVGQLDQETLLEDFILGLDVNLTKYNLTEGNVRAMDAPQLWNELYNISIAEGKGLADLVTEGELRDFIKANCELTAEENTTLDSMNKTQLMQELYDQTSGEWNVTGQLFERGLLAEYVIGEFDLNETKAEEVRAMDVPALWDNFYNLTLNRGNNQGNWTGQNWTIDLMIDVMQLSEEEKQWALANATFERTGYVDNSTEAKMKATIDFYKEKIKLAGWDRGYADGQNFTKLLKYDALHLDDLGRAGKTAEMDAALDALVASGEFYNVMVNHSTEGYEMFDELVKVDWINGSEIMDDYNNGMNLLFINTPNKANDTTNGSMIISYDAKNPDAIRGWYIVPDSYMDEVKAAVGGE